MIYKVTHAKDGVETVYLVDADGPRAAKTAVVDILYDRRFFRAEDPERLKNDTFGLLRAGQHGEWSNTKMMKDHGFSMAATPWDCSEPYRLYAIDTRTGAMS